MDHAPVVAVMVDRRPAAVNLVWCEKGLYDLTILYICFNLYLTCNGIEDCGHFT